MADDENRDSQSNYSSCSSTSEGSWWGSWGQGWIDTVKEKSALTMQMVKKDLNEFVEVIQGDTSVAISETASKIVDDSNDGEDQNEGNNIDTIESATNVVKRGMANFLHSVSELMAVPPDDSKEEVITIANFPSTASQYNRKQEKLHAIQIDPGTYCNEPEGLFCEWLEVFNLDDNKQDMSNMLVHNPAVRAIYTQLVPAVVSHTMFWQRYFYQVFLLDAEEKKREEIVARANDESNEDDTGSGWGDDDDDDGIEVVSCPSVKTTTGMDYSIITTVIDDDVDKVNVPETVEKDNILTINNTELDGDMQNVLTETPKNYNENLLSEQMSEISVEHETLLDKQTSENSDKRENLPDEQANENSQKTENLLGKQTENSEKVETSSEEQILEISSDVIDISCTVETESDNETIQGNIEEVKTGEPNPVSPHIQLMPQEHSETSSLSSWLSIDDVIKVKKIRGEQEVKSDTNGVSANVSTDSNGVIINKSDIIDESDEDFDLDIDDDVNEDEVAKMVEDIKNKSTGGTLEDDDDWENWE